MTSIPPTPDRRRVSAPTLIFCLLFSATTLPLLVHARANEAKEQQESVASAPAEEFEPAQLEFFEKKIRPLLVERCQDCHNADLSEGGLDLSSREGIIKGGDSGAAFDGIHPEASIVLEAISYKPEARMEMPPDGRLEADEVALLTKWVKEGLPWPGARPGIALDPSDSKNADFPYAEEQTGYWSFQPPTKPELPAVQNSEWVRNGIDNFILCKLEEQGMHPATKADKLTLIRRATFDLTGLPPTPEEISAFVADESPDAFIKVVDRLLATDAYGERWGRHWLDVARYADTNGMDENLSYANAYRYRNYVINAFNKDKPYDEFLTEQLAGDLMPDPEDELKTIERNIATGFLAIGPKMLAEDDPVKMHMDIIDEQVDTMGKAFLGLTLGCARCHDHKFDPVTTRDYYSLAGIFKSTKTMENYRVVANWFERPVEPQARIDAWNQYEQSRDQEQATIDKIVADVNSQFQSTARERARDYLIAATYEFYSKNAYDRMAASWNTGDASLPEGALERLTEQFDRGNVDVQVQQKEPRIAVVLTFKQGPANAVYDIDVPTAGKYAIFLQYAANESRPLKLSVNGSVVKGESASQKTGSWNHDGQRWFFEEVVKLPAGKNTIELACDKLFPHVHKLRLIPAGDESPAAVLAKPEIADLNPLVIDQWVAYLGEQQGKADSIFQPWFKLTEAVRQSSGNAEFGRLNTRIQTELAESRVVLADEYAKLFSEAASAWQQLKAAEETKDQDKLADVELEAARQVLLSDAGPFRIPENVESSYPTDIRDQLAAHRTSLQQIEDGKPEPLEYAMGVTESKVENMQVCIRGNHINLGPEVPRQFLTVIEGTDQQPLSDANSGRLALANWMTKADHPLTSRVMANRIWRWHMGTGLVRTVDNFGLTGETPTHPDLLDWLATTFIELDWSMKDMHRLIMNSATYQMSSEFSAAYNETDPENKTYWRMNRHRLEAEAVRDSILAIAGTLDRTQIGTTLTYKSHEYVNSTGGAGVVSYDFNYRSVYLPIIRSALYEMFQAFDFPDPSYMLGDRPTTTIAPQSLFLMNSDLMEEQMTAMANRLIQEAPDAAEDRIERAYELTYGRKPTVDEMEASLGFVYQYEEAVISAIPDQEKRQVQVWKGLCRVLLSSNEFIFVD